MKNGVAALLFGAALLLGLVIWLRAVGDDPAARFAVPMIPSREEASSSPSMPVSEERLRATLPASLVGTAEDGALVIDASGRFVPGSDAIDLFDYYLAAAGEESEEWIYARIVAAIEARLDGAAARDARALLDNYLHYRMRAGELLAGRAMGEDTARRLQYIRELRRDVFGADVALALFGEEEARWFVDLERRRIMQDESLGTAEREERLASLDAEHAPEARASHASARAHRALRNDEARLREGGASPSEITQLRVEQLGPEGAKRLEDLDTARAQWQRRLETYRIERDERLAEGSRDDRAVILEVLRAAHFEGAELLRVRALDRVAESASFE